MSRDIWTREPAVTLVGFSIEALVAAGVVDGEVAEEFAVCGHDPDVEVGDVEPDSCSCVSASDADVEESRVVAQGDFAGLVDAVDSNSEMGWRGW